MVGESHTLTWQKGAGHNGNIRRKLMVAGRRGISKGEVTLPFGQGWVRNTVLRVENPQLPAEGEVQRGSGVGTPDGGRCQPGRMCYIRRVSGGHPPPEAGRPDTPDRGEGPSVLPRKGGRR